MVEIWEHLEENYYISNYGNVINRNSNRILKVIKCNDYKSKVTLTLENNSRKKDVFLASEVARKFISESFNRVYRIDKDVFNNNVNNLIVV
jgi:hypothetical protein